MQSFRHIPTISGELYTENLEEAVFELLKKSKRNDFPHNEFPSIFVIDEAQFLIYDWETKSNKTSGILKTQRLGRTEEDFTHYRTAFHILRRMCRIMEEYGGIFSLL